MTLFSRSISSIGRCGELSAEISEKKLPQKRVVRLSLGKLLVDLLQVVKRTNTPLTEKYSPWYPQEMKRLGY